MIVAAIITIIFLIGICAYLRIICLNLYKQVDRLQDRLDRTEGTRRMYEPLLKNIQVLRAGREFSGRNKALLPSENELRFFMLREVTGGIPDNYYHFDITDQPNGNVRYDLTLTILQPLEKD